MSTKYHQLSMGDVYGDCQDMFLEQAPKFFQLLETHVNLNEFIPSNFHNAFYQRLGRKRDYPLTGFLTSLILQKIFTIPSDSLLILLLTICKELRDFCGFSKVPDAPLYTRFKQTFCPWIEQMFHNMVDYTEPICQAIDAGLAQMLIFDTSGIELYVKENNPKTLHSLIKQLKSYYKDNLSIDPLKMAYGLMPSHAVSSCDAKQQYINGHFCYADKFAMLTNGFGIIRHIAFLDDDFKETHPELEIEKKSDSPDEDKTIGDSSSLVPVLSDFFSLHPNIRPNTFLGDSAFDSIDIYSALKDDFGFSKALIPYNTRNKSCLEKVGVNSYGYPTCPKDNSIDMKYHGLCREKGRADHHKWGCPKIHVDKGQWVCDCNDPCSTAKRGRTSYTYENMDFRMFPGLQRDSDEWSFLYKIRTSIERSINHFKTNMCIAGRKSRNHLTTKADVFIAGIASQLSAIVASRIQQPQFIRSLRPLVA